MSILVQPKLFPLEGDSSQKLQRGKWFVKDASAIHEIPSIIITKLPDCKLIKKNEMSYLYITLTNPKDYKLNIKINNFSNNNKPILDSSDKLSEENKRCSQPFSCSFKDLYLVNNEGDIYFELGPFEDELLRDDNDELSDENYFFQNSDVTSPEMISRGWSCKTSHNIAHLMIKVAPKISSKNIISDSNTEDFNSKTEDNQNGIAAYVLPLLVTTEKNDQTGGKPAVNIFQFQSIIGFPNTAP